jgi:hypothetical protein
MGSWLYSVLPYMEESALWSMGQGQTGITKKATLSQRNQQPVSAYYCPSRRRAAAYSPGNSWPNADAANVIAKNDYAANLGGLITTFAFNSPSTTDAGDNNWPWPKESSFDGVIYLRSHVKIAQITDGTTRTYLFGEKYLNPDYYEGQTVITDFGDDQGAYSGYNADVNRTTHLLYPPLQDTPGFTRTFNFGSAHSSVFYMAMCDGSVRGVSYDIDRDVHKAHGSRAGSEVEQE